MRLQYFGSISRFNLSPSSCFCGLALFAPILSFGQHVAPHGGHSGHLTGAGKENAVISIRYNCVSEQSQKPDVCEKIVSKHEFDTLAHALDPNMPADARRSLASEYSRLLVMAAEARRRGLDQLPEIRTLLEFSNLQLLGSKLLESVKQEVAPVSDHAVEQYFRDHEKDYQEVVLSRIFVPASLAQGKAPLSDSKAAQMRQRALAGADFAVLQREIPQSPANVRLGPMPCKSLPESHRPICELGVNEVSPIITDSTGYSIYRIESKRRRELGDVRPEIRSTLEREYLQESIQRVRTPVLLDLDEAYFGKLPNPDLAHQHGMHFPNVQKKPQTADQSHHH